MKAKHGVCRVIAAVCVTIVSSAGLSVRAGGYVGVVTNTPGLRHFWMLDEPGTPAVSADIIGGKTATHMSGFPPSVNGGGPVSTEGPRPADGFAGMASDNAALLYSISGKTRSFINNPDQLGDKSFAADDIHGMSMEFWFKRTTTNTEGVVAGYLDADHPRYGYVVTMIRSDPSTQIPDLKVYNKDAEERQTIYELGTQPDFLWHHMVMTWDGRNLRSYLDGKEPATSVARCSGSASGPIKQAGELVFGGDASTVDFRYLNGALDKVAIYDRPLTDAQVARHYEAAVTGSVKLPHYEQAVLALNPCHYWRMEETHGRILDSIGDWSLTLRTGTMPWASVGLRPPSFLGLETNNCAMGFIRANGHGLYNTNALVDALTSTNSFSAGTVDKLSMSVWFRLSETGPDNERQVIAGFQKLAGYRYVFLVLREGSGALRCYVTDNSGDSQLIKDTYANITDSNWHNFVMTWDGSAFRTYLDGGNEKFFTDANVSGALRASDGFFIGQDINNSSFFDGEIDEVALFSDALTAQQVADLYAAAVRGKIPQGTLMRLCNSTTQGAVLMPKRGVCAHRGAMSTHPENTLAAFREAVRLGAHMIEFDINLTKDERIVLMHDLTVDRTTNGSGKVTDLTFDQIRSLDAGSWKEPQFAGERVPTLEEALAMMPLNVWLNVHTKGSSRLAEMAAQEIARQGRTHQAFLATERAPATAARVAVPDILICNMQNQGHDAAYVTDTISHGDAFLQLLHQLAAPADMERLKTAGVRVNCFLGGGNPKTAAELTALFEAGVEFPLVDDLEPMMEAARQFGIEPLTSEHREPQTADMPEHAPPVRAGA